MLERGEIAETEFWSRLDRHVGGEFDLDRLRALFFERLEPNPPMIELVRELRGGGIRAALLTNNVREWEPLWRAKLPEIDELFEVVVDSAFVGVRKPDPEIYSLTLERLGGVAAGAVRVRGRPRRELRHRARPRHDGRALRESRIRPSRRSGRAFSPN